MFKQTVETLQHLTMDLSMHHVQLMAAELVTGAEMVSLSMVTVFVSVRGTVIGLELFLSASTHTMATNE